MALLFLKWKAYRSLEATDLFLGQIAKLPSCKQVEDQRVKVLLGIMSKKSAWDAEAAAVACQSINGCKHLSKASKNAFAERSCFRTWRSRRKRKHRVAVTDPYQSLGFNLMTCFARIISTVFINEPSNVTCEVQHPYTNRIPIVYHTQRCTVYHRIPIVYQSYTVHT